MNMLSDEIQVRDVNPIEDALPLTLHAQSHSKRKQNDEYSNGEKARIGSCIMFVGSGRDHEGENCSPDEFRYKQGKG